MAEKSPEADWPSLTKVLSERLHGRLFHPVVSDLLRRKRVSRILVACSGGADSIFLLSVLSDQAEKLGLKLIVAHYNHRWRGEASDADAEFVEDVAKSLNCEYVGGVRSSKEAAFTETTARALRLEFLRQEAAEQHCDWIALGHQMNDILETQLQRLGRGSGSEGLAAPRPISSFVGHPSHIRPILHLRRGEIRMHLNVCGLPWREDASNTDVVISRNALRHKVIPEMNIVLDRDASSGAARSRMLLEEDALALNLWVRERFSGVFEGQKILERRALKSAPRALTRRVLIEWLSRQGQIHSLSAAGMDLLVEAVYENRGKNKLSLGKSYICLNKEEVFIEQREPATPHQVIEPVQLNAGDSVILSSGRFLETEFVRLTANKREAVLNGKVDQKVEAYILCPVGEVLEVRGWRPGDRFRPIGAPGTKKLKDWFIDRHIPQKERKFAPIVLSSSQEVIWVPGFPPADSVKIGACAKVALRLTYENRETL